MPVTITFHKLSEKQPNDGQYIIWLKNTTTFGFQGFDPQECRAEYVWYEVDEENLWTGNSALYEGEPYKIGGIMAYENTRWKLVIQLDGWQVDENTLWVDVEEYWKCFEEEE